MEENISQGIPPEKPLSSDDGFDEISEDPKNAAQLVSGDSTSDKLTNTPMPLEPTSEPVDRRRIDETSGESNASEAKTGVKEKILWGAAGALAVASVGLTLATNELDQLKEQALGVVPWAAGGIIASEAAFVGGGAMMLGALGQRARRFFQIKGIKKDVSAMQTQALQGKFDKEQGLIDNPLFKAGFVTNALGALGTAGVAIAAAVKLPVETWGVMPLAFADIALTLTFRSAIWKALKLGGKK